MKSQYLIHIVVDLVVIAQLHDATYYRLKFVVVQCNNYCHRLRVQTLIFSAFIEFITIHVMYNKRKGANIVFNVYFPYLDI